MAADPSRIKEITTNGENFQVYVIDNIPIYTKEDYNLEDNKDMERFIFDIEKDVRISYEYQEMIKYLRQNMNMDRCSYFTGVTNRETPAIKIHIHHSPITLYEIVVIVLEKRKYYGESLLLEKVSEEVAYLHYCFLVGLIPLCETIHELVHNEYLFIPNDAVMGYYNKFTQMYYPWVPTQVKDKIDRLDKFTLAYNEAENLKVIQPNYIYLDLAGTYKLPKMETIMEVLSTRMDSIRNNGFSLEPQPLIRFFDENGKYL